MTLPLMARYALRRLAALLLLLLILSFVVFSLLALAPGDTATMLLGGRPTTPEAMNAVRERYNLNDPFLVQYGKWLWQAMHLHLGQSIRTGQPVLTALRDRLGVTAELGAFAFAITLALGIPLGIVAALKKGRWIDRMVVTLSVVGVSAPAFATGIFLLYIFGVLFGWFPTFGVGTGLLGRAHHLVLPAVALAIAEMALVVKLTRVSMIQSLEQDAVAFARARGLSSRRVLTSYALRNALIPIVTASGNLLATFLSGAVLIEVTFALPGVGALLVDSVNSQDIPVVQGLALMIAVLVVLVNLVTDLLYGLIDPRIRFGKATA